MAWSDAKGIVITDNHYDPSKYFSVYAEWFQKSWWTKWDWGWIYTNESDMSLKLTKATFNACAGHSNGKYYCGAPGAGPTLITYGYGCRFTSDVYVIGSSGEQLGSASGIGSCEVQSIDSYNCAFNGVKGEVAAYTQQTSFGNPAYGWGGNKQWHPIPITYDVSNMPAVPPGGKLMIIIRPIQWYTSGNDALLVMKGDSSNFTSEFQPENDDYIWVCKKKDGDTSPKWYKEKKAFMMTNIGWEEMEKI